MPKKQQLDICLIKMTIKSLKINIDNNMIEEFFHK